MTNGNEAVFGAYRVTEEVNERGEIRELNYES